MAAAISSGQEEFPWWAYLAIGLFVFCCCCIPFCLFCYARRRFGEGNEFLWFRYLLYQTNPRWPLFYMPKDVHDRLKMQLYHPEKFEAELAEWEKEVKEQQAAAKVKEEGESVTVSDV